ncbi:hypothetical protein NUW54_g3122 [Trametes sanguinea]|uniref:Uncharacterized protein n=1 Tax=Trametes sanguinea TaxID=158606 RepID=A0ACC1Q5A2_9APHY|nr:hypothetical protein NUW54_g3122 [Trametes sanguinea]
MARSRHFTVSPDGRWMFSGSDNHSPPNGTSSADLLARPSRAPYQYGAYYPTLRLHDASGQVFWIEHVTSSISSLALSDDCTRLVTSLADCRLLLYDVTQLIHPDTTLFNLPTILPRSDASPNVPEYALNTGNSQPIAQILFSLDGRRLVSPGSYILLPAEWCPLSLQNRAERDQSSPHVYYFDDGWLWRSVSDTGCERVCWVPPAFRRDDFDIKQAWSVRGHTVACQTQDSRLVILDASSCQRSGAFITYSESVISICSSFVECMPHSRLPDDQWRAKRSTRSCTHLQQALRYP